MGRKPLAIDEKKTTISISIKIKTLARWMDRGVTPQQIFCLGIDLYDNVHFDREPESDELKTLYKKIEKIQKITEV